MKGKHFMALMVAMVAMFTSCDSTDEYRGEIDYVPVQVEEDGKWGMMGPDGKMLYTDEFTNEPTLVINGLFSVKEGEHYALYAAEKKPRLIPGCDDLKYVGMYNGGVIPVTRPKSRITLINDDGKTVATLNPIGGKEIIHAKAHMTEGLIAVRTEDQLVGFVDKTGKVVIEPKYTEVFPFSEGLALVVRIVKGEYALSIIDTKGKEISRLKKGMSPASRTFIDGRMTFQNQDGRWGFIDKKGEFTKVSSKVSYIGEYNSKYFTYMNKEGNWGLMSIDGEETLIRPKYNSLRFRSDGTFLAKDGEDYLVINENGDKQFEITDYTHITIPYPQYGMIGVDGSRYLFLGADGKPINKEEFTDYGTKFYQDDLVYSDYFNSDAVAQSILNMISQNGIDKYHIGETAAQLGLNAEEYRWTSSFENDSIAPKGWRYNGSVRVNMSESIANGDYNSFYDYVYTLNPLSKVCAISITIGCETECWDDVKPLLISGLKNKGFKIDDEDKDELNFKGKECDITAYSLSNGKTISLWMSKPATQTNDLETPEIMIDSVVDSLDSYTYTDTVVAW